jgi:hypothetical protein
VDYIDIYGDKEEDGSDSITIGYPTGPIPERIISDYQDEEETEEEEKPEKNKLSSDDLNQLINEN